MTKSFQFYIVKNFISLNPAPPLDLPSIAQCKSLHLNPWKTYWLVSLPLLCPHKSVTTQNV